MAIHGRVRVIAAFSHPLTQTLLPDALNAAFEALQLDLVCVPFDVPPGHLRNAVNALRHLSFAGASIGMPHKEEILHLLDDMGPTARLVGSVDHVNLQVGSKIMGHNADTSGALSLLKEDAGLSLAGKKALLFGSGGTARSFAVGLLENGAEIRISNRTPDRAESLLKYLKRLVPDAKLGLVPYEPRAVKNAVAEVDLVINATPSNLEGDQGPLVTGKDLHPALTVVDANVSRVTPLVLAARKEGAAAFTGARLVFWHAVHTFRLWTGQAAPRETLERALGGVLAVTE